eukprot:2361177-Pleurochrysis_carterae.AAC.4
MGLFCGRVVAASHDLKLLLHCCARRVDSTDIPNGVRGSRAMEPTFGIVYVDEPLQPNYLCLSAAPGFEYRYVPAMSSHLSKYQIFSSQAQPSSLRRVLMAQRIVSRRLAQRSGVAPIQASLPGSAGLTRTSELERSATAAAAEELAEPL